MDAIMKEKKLQVFLQIISNYFAQLGGEALKVETPYLSADKQPEVYDYTGIIGVSGGQKGVVYFSATQSLLCCILQSIGESDASEENLVDIAGEVANTIAGNARKEFGAEFHISVPLVFKGVPQSIVLPKDERSFIIPIAWRGQLGEIVLCFQK